MFLNMNARNSQAQLLKTLSHPTRLAVLEILRDGEQCVCHMEAMLGLRQASISQQLMVLREAGLVSVRRSGLNMYYRVTRPQVFTVLDALNAASGKPRARVAHKHGPADCPCPKCNTAKPISPSQVDTIKAGR
jgi:DNA-binding transcriptional ArsR family regulator